MKTYLVGGAVRDELLGLPVRERDWVVVGARPEELAERGYRRVGRDFPVFLHPETQEEYALARVERKTAPGYHGFAVRFSPEVTLEEDLQRRDLTINAMARDDQGLLVDPYGGQADLAQRLLRHVSEAFAEDPVRVLRVARFAARLAPLGFTVAPETRALLRRMVDSGEVGALVPERTWQETVRALGEARPDVFFTTLRECGALDVIFPELAKLWGVPQPARWHPEIDTGVHVMMVLRVAAERTPSARIRFAALTHDLGKGQTRAERWPAHHGHEERSVRLVEQLADRLRIPNDFRELAHITARYHGLSHRALELRASTLLELLEHLDAFRRPERFGEFLVACECDLRGRAGFESRHYPQAGFLELALETATAAVLTPEDRAKWQGPALGERLHEKRIAALGAMIHEHRARFIAAK
jgi:tRNA nucleotidyltransferase (CCA-adding enzyme)